MRLPARSPTASPARLLPVSETASTRSSSISRMVSSGVMRSVVTTFSGNPAFRKASSMASAVIGTFAACFSSSAFPAATAGTATRKTCQNGKFQGSTASTTPSGSKVI